jgi:hypothetical protein
MIPPITGGFEIVPFESFILHKILLNSSYCQLSIRIACRGLSAEADRGMRALSFLS